MAFARLPDAVEQRGVFQHLDERAAELAMVGRRHFAAKLRDHRLLAIADAKHRQARIENALRRARAFVRRHRCRSARKDHAFGFQPVERRLGRPEWRDLAINRSEEHTSELQSLMRISYAVFCLKKK